MIWSEMKAIRWPESRNSEAKIEIAVPKSTDWPLAKAALDLQSLSPEDRLLLIRYLRLHVADKEEAGWPQFCQKRAVPLVEALKKRETDDGASERPLAGEFLNRHLFLTGLLSPLLFARFVVREVSREMWWTTRPHCPIGCGQYPPRLGPLGVAVYRSGDGGCRGDGDNRAVLAIHGQGQA